MVIYMNIFKILETTTKHIKKFDYELIDDNEEYILFKSSLDGFNFLIKYKKTNEFDFNYLTILTNIKFKDNINDVYKKINSFNDCYASTLSYNKENGIFTLHKDIYVDNDIILSKDNINSFNQCFTHDVLILKLTLEDIEILKEEV